MKCPKCKKDTAELMHDGIWNPKYKVKCYNCGLETDQYDSPMESENAWKTIDFKVENSERVEVDPNNPYTDFAKEMSLLHEALKAEGFKDSMVDILSKMAPIVWDKVELKRARELHNVRRAARRYGRAVEEKSDETFAESFAESFVREVNADNLLRNQESMDAIVKKGLGL